MTQKRKGYDSDSKDNEIRQSKWQRVIFPLFIYWHSSMQKALPQHFLGCKNWGRIPGYSDTQLRYCGLRLPTPSKKMVM